MKGSPIFRLRMPVEDRLRLDRLAELWGQPRGAVLKQLVRDAESGGQPSDSMAGETVFQADSPAMSDQL